MSIKSVVVPAQPGFTAIPTTGLGGRCTVIAWHIAYDDVQIDSFDDVGACVVTPITLYGAGFDLVQE